MRFQKTLDPSPTVLAIVKAISEIARAFSRKTVAEWFENENVAKIVRELAVDYRQGYLYSKPIPIDAFLLQTEI